MKKLSLLLLSILFTIYGWTQGCVAIRNVAGVSPDLLFENIQQGDKLIFNVTNRYFEASSSFRGDTFITDSLVTNKIYTLNISVLRLLNSGWSIGLSVPVSANSRNNGADHMGAGTLPRYTTHAFGLGDIRFAVYKWILDPATNRKGNVQAGLGIKLPTGDYKYQDYFHRKADSTVLAPVDQAIQLGDGGTGITAELSAFYSLGQKINLFMQGFYLMNPREQNGVSNLKGRNANATQNANNTTVMSVPDQYSIRAGANYQFREIVLSGSLRYERVPDEDLIGGNKGFRRVATITSAEAAITYKMKNTLAFVNLGIPFYRDIEQNIQNDKTPAGFSDWVLTFGVQFKL